jgi:membrane associated rhomboid family serine protease
MASAMGAERSTPAITPAVTWMAGFLAAIHFLQWTVVLPSDAQQWLAFRVGDIESGRWWSVATYPLVHGSATVLLLNIYALMLFGPRLERFWGSRRFAGFVALAVLGGWIAHLFVGGSEPLLSASAASFGVMGAYAWRWGSEERPLLGGFVARERWAVAFIVAVMVLSGMQEPVGGGLPFLAHLGGLGTAWVFARATSVLFVERFREGVSAMPDEPPEDQPPRAVPKTLPRSRAQRETIDDVVTRSNADIARQRSTAREAKTPANDATPTVPPTIDAILDKIGKAGLDALSTEERRVLDEHSRRLRDG